jgi:hypothetical protein
MTARRPNYLGIVAGSIVFWLFGWVWYGMIFGTAWMAAVGKTQEAAMAAGYTPMIVSFVAGLFIAYCFDNMLWHYERGDAMKGAQVGFLTGVCIAAAMLIIAYTYAGRPLALMLIDSGYAVIGFVITGAVVGALRAWAQARAAKAA